VTFIDTAPETVGLATMTALRKKLEAAWLAEAATAGLDEGGMLALFMSKVSRAC
jgi:hypothetical protein